MATRPDLSAITSASRASAPPVMGDSRRPLYLGVRVRARVDADGPALRVRAVGRADTRYPLARVSRVIASARVDWGATALRACLDSGIPILTVGEDGAPLGAFHPARVCATRLAEDIDELLDRPDWREAYGIWLRSARMRILREWREARWAEGTPPAPGEFGELVRRHVYCAEPNSPFADATGLWRGALCALAVGAIRSAGLQPVYWGAGGGALELLADLTRILELRLRLDVREGIECGLEGEAVVLLAFHALSRALEVEAQRTIDSLARRVKQVLAEWR